MFGTIYDNLIEYTFQKSPLNENDARSMLPKICNDSGSEVEDEVDDFARRFIWEFNTKLRTNPEFRSVYLHNAFIVLAGLGPVSSQCGFDDDVDDRLDSVWDTLKKYEQAIKPKPKPRPIEEVLAECDYEPSAIHKFMSIESILTATYERGLEALSSDTPVVSADVKALNFSARLMPKSQTKVSPLKSVPTDEALIAAMEAVSQPKTATVVRSSDESSIFAGSTLPSSLFDK